MSDIDLCRISLVREASFPYNKQICSAQDIVDFVNEHFNLQNAPDEYIYIFCLDAKGNIIGIHEVSHGSVSETQTTGREIFKRALINNAVSIIMIHNHPSGDTCPSPEDFTVTEKTKEGGILLGIRLLDHIIIGRDSYYSFSENSEV